MPAFPSRWMTIAVYAALLSASTPAGAQDDERLGFERTPPRLSFIEGEVSFLRTGAPDWSPAHVNTALAAGDELYAGEAANLELQIAARAYVRAGENSQLGLTSLEPDFLQLRVTSGTVSLDLRSRTTSQTLEIDTPNAAFTVERIGYYRVEVDGDTTTFTSRRGGRATLTPASGQSVLIAASEQVVVTGDLAPQIGSYAAPELDAWDRWNYTRTDDQIEAVSARYVPADVYGVDDLDHHGDWRVVDNYGPVWLPRGVGANWAPYSTGRWLWDPYYGWTWVDDAPWGWAPYHYGRWVRISNHWAWCPGPIVARPYYAPALVAFYGGGGFSVGVSIGTPYVGWLPLGWGEPLVPWWGPKRFRSRAHWAGWGGPRIVNNVVIHNKTVIHTNEIKSYRNARERGAFMKVDGRDFGRRDRDDVRFERGKPDDFRPVYGDHPARPDRSSLVAKRGSGVRPPNEAWKRSVVATRAPRREASPEFEVGREESKEARKDSRAKPGVRSTAPGEALPTRVVEAPRGSKRAVASDRAPFGKRSVGERAAPPPAPSFKRSEREVTSARKAEPKPRDSTPVASIERESTRERKRESTGESARESTRESARENTRESTRESARESTRESARDAAPRGDRQTKQQAKPPRQSAARPAAAEPDRAQRSQPERDERRAAQRSPDLPGEPANRVYQQPKSRSERAPAKSRDVERNTRREEGSEPSSETRSTGRGSGGGKSSARAGGGRSGRN